MKNNLGIIVFLYFLTFLNLLLDIYSLIFYLTLKKKFDFFYNIDNQVWQTDLLKFFHCALSNVFSNPLHERMHSHSGCTCLVFLHCVFSNVSLNRLHVRLHSHIGCISLPFGHCGFSYVLSKDLHKTM